MPGTMRGKAKTSSSASKGGTSSSTSSRSFRWSRRSMRAVMGCCDQAEKAGGIKMARASGRMEVE